MLRKPELVLPAGSMDALKAAVLNGADAVYFGAKKFNARLRAENFDDRELADAIDFCHYHGKKAYLAINTLLKDQELAEAIELAKKAYCQGIDAVIVQDLGLIMALHELLPDLKLTASTQMTCHNKEGAEFLADLGIKRIVLARELSLKEIKEIKQAMEKRGVEIECFVHGALCFSYSGQCLFSSFAFGKSGNRGQCLQPCRMLYTLISSKGEKKNGYFLSMTDLMTIEKIRELTQAGIDAFKVEGRLKGVGYPAIIAKNYRKAIDCVFGGGQEPASHDIKLMKIAFLRKNNAGYLFGEKEMVCPESSARQGIPAAMVLGFKGKNVELKLMENIFKYSLLSAIQGENVENFSVKKIVKGKDEAGHGRAGETVGVEFYHRPFLEKGQMIYFTRSKQLDDLAYSSIARAKKTSYNLLFKAAVGKKNSAVISFNNKKKEVFMDFVPTEQSKTKGLEKIFEQKLFKESGFFEPGKFTCELNDKPFIPLSILKKFKNQILAEAREMLFEKTRRKINEEDFSAKLEELFDKVRETKKEPLKKQRFAVFLDEDGANCIEKAGLASKISELADVIVFSCAAGEKINKVRKRFAGKEFVVKTENIQETKKLEEFKENVLEKNTKILCSNLGAIGLAVKSRKEFWVGSELNVFNSLAEKLLIGKGASKIIPSVELSLKELEELLYRKALVPLVFFYPLLMVSKAYSKSDLLKEKSYVLVDRKGFRYKMVFDDKKILRIYNPVPVDMLFEIEKFSEFGLLGIDLTSLDSGEMLQVIEYALGKTHGKKPKKTAKFTRGHYINAVE